MDPDAPAPQHLLRLLRRYPAEKMTAYPVIRAVNIPRNQGQLLIQPIADVVAR